MSGTTTNKKYIRRRRGACDSCKQRKVRCDGENPCAACHRSSTTCRYQQPATRARLSVHASIDSEISQSRRPPSLLLNTTLSPTWDRSNDYSCFTPDDSCWSSVSWRGDVAQNIIFSPDIECFEGANIDTDCAWQSVWAYPGELAKQPQLQQNFGFQSPLQETSGFGPFTPEETADHHSSALLTPSPERSFQDHVIFPSDQSENFDHVQTLYDVPTFSSKTLFSDSRFINLEKFGEPSVILGVLNDIQQQYFMLRKPSYTVNPPDTRYDAQSKTYIDACFEAPLCISLFLDRAYLDWMAHQVLEKKSRVEYHVTLIYAALAIGCYIVRVEREGSVKQGFAEASALFEIAENCQRSNVSREIRKENFLATLVMLLFAQKCSREREISLLNTVSSIAIGLELHNINMIQKLCDNEKSKSELQRAFWLYYSIEKPHSLRLGHYSMIDDDLLNHQPPREELKLEQDSTTSSGKCVMGIEDGNVLLLQCRFAKICSLIITKLYAPYSLRKSPSELFNSIFQLGGMLKHWKDSLPSSTRPLDLTSASTFVPELCKASQEQLNLSYQYYEALWAIHGRWRLCNPLQMTDEDMGHMATSREICSNVARMVLNTSGEFRIANLLSHWSISQLPLIASLIIFLDAVDLGMSLPKENLLPYLSIAEGFYGRLSTLENTPYKIVLSMNRILRQILFR
ncbi:Fumonisin cluster-specific transcription factor FUM21 [Golovinomyces cichoracearum]|uniref:Fumonisin cluster-specific transcription factor FUM21 n=1 Tax=Golovinomyces cichoracearum TaxID=62708 RepID=A0A420IWS2_9PEZI|nr:Fumonisin cluster-specific transcription factor FUM21 [Golovinomyces cichoracearum]